MRNKSTKVVQSGDVDKNFSQGNPIKQTLTHHRSNYCLLQIDSHNLNECDDEGDDHEGAKIDRVDVRLNEQMLMQANVIATDHFNVRNTEGDTHIGLVEHLYLNAIGSEHPRDH